MKHDILNAAVAAHGQLRVDAVFSYARSGWDKDDQYTPAMITRDILAVSSAAEIDALITAYGYERHTQELYVEMVVAGMHASEDRFGSWESYGLYDYDRNNPV